MVLTFTEQDIKRVARTLIQDESSGILCLHGPMGAGKTTLVKAMLRELNAIDPGSSPTFGLVNEYHDTEGKLLAYHFDFYRLNSPEEALDMGLEEYLEQPAWIFIEWPELVQTLLPADSRHLYLEPLNENERQVTF